MGDLETYPCKRGCGGTVTVTYHDDEMMCQPATTSVHTCSVCGVTTTQTSRLKQQVEGLLLALDDAQGDPEFLRMADKANEDYTYRQSDEYWLMRIRENGVEIPADYPPWKED